MKITYKQRLFSIILIMFAMFSLFLILSERNEQKKYKTQALESKLDGYVELIHQYIEINNINDSAMALTGKLTKILPDDLRVTVVDATGKVIYDRDVSDINTLDNHIERPEIMRAQYQDSGTNIRMSASTNQEYIYYAKFYKGYFVRVALPYDIQVRSMLKADNWFIYVVAALFIIVLVLVNIVAERFGKSITKLKNFALDVKNDKPLPENLSFPNDELGEIGKDLVDIFRQKEKGRHTIEVEKEKLIQHFLYSEMGLCMFSADYKKISVNAHFMQYLNLILSKPTFDVNSIFEDESFAPVVTFLQSKDRPKYKTFQIERNGKVFSIQIIVFDDESFEVTIKDITRIEKNKHLKQEITNNIAHELKTPVTSLRGYLETLNEQNLPDEKRKQFIERAYQQVIRLSMLIDDVSLLSNIEEAPAKFGMEKINLFQLINDVRIDLSDKLDKQSIRFNFAIKEGLSIKGNYTLLYSVFRNLADNSISYAGNGIDINITNYMEDDTFLYFLYYDTGKGVGDIHLNRLFERFYRVQEGRTRDTGGSGLGLSIVKNAILLHNGEIQARNRKEGGLEFLFTLRK